MPAVVPDIVATSTFIDQTAAIGTTTLYTPPAAGLFRVSMYYMRQAGAGVNMNPTVAWTDRYAGHSYNGNNIQTGVAFMTCFDVQSEASQPITLACTITGSPTYSIYITIEHLADL